MPVLLLQIADLTLPVAVCEPVTDMQRRGDFLEYVELLHEVCFCPTLWQESIIGVSSIVNAIDVFKQNVL